MSYEESASLLSLIYANEIEIKITTIVKFKLIVLQKCELQ